MTDMIYFLVVGLLIAFFAERELKDSPSRFHGQLIRSNNPVIMALRVHAMWQKSALSYCLAGLAIVSRRVPHCYP